jgi:thiamine biosynthesis protein ThiS
MAAGEVISVQVNGERRGIGAAGSALDLLRGLDLDPRSVVVEVNKQIVRRSALAATPIHEGDEIELVHFVGGG